MTNKVNMSVEEKIETNDDSSVVSVNKGNRPLPHKLKEELEKEKILDTSNNEVPSNDGFIDFSEHRE